MAKLKCALAKQIAELERSAPKDFDPEGNDNLRSSGDENDSEDSNDGVAATEHYAEVGKSKIRRPEEISLGPQYVGSRVSREELLNGDNDSDDSDVESADEPGQYAELDMDVEVDDDDGEIDSDAVFGESDDGKFKDFVFRGSGKPRVVNGSAKRPTAADFMSGSEGDDAPLNVNESDEIDEEILDVDMQHGSGTEDMGSADEGSEFEGEEDSEAEVEEGAESDEGSSYGGDDDTARRAELKKIMGEEQQTVVATISQAAKVDAAKGNAVRTQRKAFDSLLSIRMVLQKALIATNSMEAVGEKPSEDDLNSPYEAAEEAATKLWNTIDGLRYDLSKANASKTGQKRKRGVDVTTPSSKVWERMQSSEISMIDTRQTTLDKWSTKVRSTTALPLSRKLNPTATEQSITSVLQDQLARSDHLIQRTKIPRSCAPIQRDAKLIEDPKIYDDGNFYQLLLKELVDQRRMDSISGSAVTGEVGNALQWTAVKEAKTRKIVDTKASKGRKLRYTVHEKLQNFMAPEDRSSWEQDAIDRLFGSLLGQKMTLGEEEGKNDEDDELPLEEEGLKLFRS